MAHEYVKISELDPASGFNTNDLFVIVQNDQTLKINGSDLINSLATVANFATRSFVTAIVDSAPETLDTLKELAAALNDDANFASTITTLIGTKLDTSNFGFYFWNEVAKLNTYNIAEGSNLYFTEQRVLDVLDSIPPPPPPDRLVNGDYIVSLATTGQLNLPGAANTESNNARIQSANSIDIVSNLSIWTFGTDGSLTLAADPVSDNHAATKSYVDSQLNSIEIKSDRLVSGSKEVVLQSNGYITLANGAQLYDYGSGVGNGYGITDSLGATYIGYDPDDAGGALHMDAYNGKNIRIRTTPAGTSNYKDWLFDSTGVLSIPVGGDIKRNGVSVLGGGSSFSGNYNDLTNKPVLFSGSYNDLTSKPTLFSGNYNDLTSKPTLFSGNYNDLTNKPTNPTFASVTATQLNVQNVTFTGIGAVKFESGNDLNFVAAGDITFNGSKLATVAKTGSYTDLTNKPTLFSGSYTDLTNKPNTVEKATGSWTLAAGANTVSLTVPGPGTFSIWVNGNIPNGIVTYTATVVVTNTNVPAVGNSYGWYYAAGGQLVLTAIPNHIVGTANNISTYSVATTTAYTFTFGITNNSGSSKVVDWGYTKL